MSNTFSSFATILTKEKKRHFHTHDKAFYALLKHWEKCAPNTIRQNTRPLALRKGILTLGVHPHASLIVRYQQGKLLLALQNFFRSKKIVSIKLVPLPLQDTLKPCAGEKFEPNKGGEGKPKVLCGGKV